jgi:hypothetical protein
MKIKLYTASGPGVKSVLVAIVEVDMPNNAYPDVVLYEGRTFIQTPVSIDYREVVPVIVRSKVTGGRHV